MAKYLVFLALNGISFIMKNDYFNSLEGTCVETNDAYTQFYPACACAYLYPYDGSRMVTHTVPEFENVVSRIGSTV